ncbi:MAG TPA: CHASE domain-containing protein [Rectinemataceae bacterium]|nr:CHASE domain-containing protein [Rectinemataceae bacterium]
MTASPDHIDTIDPRRGRVLACCVIVLGLAFTVVGSSITRAAADRLNERVFTAICDETATRIENRVRADILMLHGGIGFMKASDDVSRSQWEAYAMATGSNEWFPGIQGFGYAKLVPRRGLTAHEEAVRAEGFPTYRVWPEGDRASYAPILYLEPFSGRNLRAFGFDLLSEEQRRVALEKARDEGMPAMTGKVELVQETSVDVQAGILILLPLYRSGMPVDSIAQRRLAIQGWVYCPIRMDDFMTGLMPELGMQYGGHMRLRIHDGDTTGALGLLFDSDKQELGKPQQAARFSTKVPIDVAGRLWTLEFSQSFTNAFTSEYRSIGLVLGGGILVTLLTAWLVLSLLNTNYTAHRLARRLNRKVLELNEGLEKRVSERTAELEKAKSLAESASAAKSEFLSSMSHELRTPMNSILGFGQLLERDDSLKPSQADFVQEILKAGRHLLELINEVLDLSRIDTGRIELSFETVGCREIAEEALALLAPMAEARGIAFRNGIGAAESVKADRFRLKQILVNLVSNAVKYNHEGGSVELRAESTDEGVRIDVRDSGCGIPEDKMGELFSPFNRLGREVGEIEGTGIGLVISKRLVQSMGGNIGAESVEGEGSRFWVLLPRAETGGEDAAASADVADGSIGDRAASILFIDDNEVNLRLVETILAQRQAVALITAPSPSVGMELAKIRRPDLILIDLETPGMEHFELSASLDANAPGRRIPVVAISSASSPRDVERAKSSGFFDLLSKPLDVDRFLDLVDRLVPKGA